MEQKIDLTDAAELRLMRAQYRLLKTVNERSLEIAERSSTAKEAKEKIARMMNEVAAKKVAGALDVVGEVGWSE